MTTPFSKDVLKINCAEQVEIITRGIRELLTSFKRRGVVLGLSGGIDSSCTAALAVRAVGKERVFGIHMPDRHSSEDTLSYSQAISNHFGFDSAIEDITKILEAVGCYSRQERAFQMVIPEYGPGWKSKIVLENILTNQGFNYFSVVAQSPDGKTLKAKLSLEAYLGVLAATNFKQRVRKMMEYYYADRLNYAVAGTPNRLEYDQGFFVKLGDGAADFKPIAHLYKTQVYQLAEYLGVPEKNCRRAPTTDTYSLEQGQDEFYFSLPYEKMDLCLYAKNHGVPVAQVAPVVGLTSDQVEKVFKDIEMKRVSTRYLHLKPQLVVSVPELLA
ncbi:MAG: NAD(+) synthase [Verrucomicrobiae bacterium]|nr:NAD(+) synthase [Verrucomicrobiae bacterium]